MNDVPQRYAKERQSPLHIRSLMVRLSLPGLNLLSGFSLRTFVSFAVQKEVNDV